MSNAKEYDILVLGATGFTGRLITRYLASHPQLGSFSLAVGARSHQKLQRLVDELKIPASVKLVNVDVTKNDQVEKAVQKARVVLNTVGPFWRWGPPVVLACARNGVHYVDLTGETIFIRKIINECDYLATKTGSIIVPSSGMDSVPSDISAFLANKTLKSLPPNPNGELYYPGESTTCFKVKGGISGGTVGTALMVLNENEVSKKIREEADNEYVLSPVKGPTPPSPKLVYKLPIPGAQTLIGAFFLMQPTNKRLVQRTFGLLETEAKSASNKNSEVEHNRYGPEFTYDEFLWMPSEFWAATVTITLGAMFGLLAFFSPLRWLVNKLAPPGSGPADDTLKDGFIVTTNITKSTSTPPIYVKTVMKGKGEPGYYLTSIMISESALALVVPPVSSPSEDPLALLPPLAKKGGVLTPMTAFGDVLIKRLEDTKLFEFSSSVVDASGKKSV